MLRIFEACWSRGRGIPTVVFQKYARKFTKKILLSPCHFRPGFEKASGKYPLHTYTHTHTHTHTHALSLFSFSLSLSLHLSLSLLSVLPVSLSLSLSPCLSLPHRPRTPCCVMGTSSAVRSLFHRACFCHVDLRNMKSLGHRGALHCSSTPQFISSQMFRG